ncbi:cytochrome C, partial [Vibrio parahaemolyticus]|nr:cytochrome C [Vibrio parahaemolyticus]
MKRFYSLFALPFISTLVLANAPLPDRQKELPAIEKEKHGEYLKPRDLSTIPNTAFGEQVKRGYSLFVNSQQMRGKYVGNEQNCVNCHMEAGRKANAAPLWAAYMAYPAYRKKNDRVNSYADRIQGCFEYSMNGK